MFTIYNNQIDLNNYNYNKVYKCISQDEYDELYYGIKYKDNDMKIYINFNLIQCNHYKIRLYTSDVNYFSITIEEGNMHRMNTYILINNIITLINLKLHDNSIMMSDLKNIKGKFKYNKETKKEYNDINLLIYHFILNKKIHKNQKIKQKEEEQLQKILKESEEYYKKHKKYKQEDEKFMGEVLKESEEYYKKHKKEDEKLENEVLEVVKKLSKKKYEIDADYNNPFLLDEGVDDNYDIGSDNPFDIHSDRIIYEQIEGH